MSILTDHITNNDSTVHFSLEDESEGTKKLFHLTGGWIKSLEGGATLLVDELESSLHPFISKFLVGLFHSSKNINNAQLVFTTHDTNLLDTNLLRRDQIWFVEKNSNKATELYSLLEYKPRKDEVIERGYLKGRYGAIPFVREF
jgi:AAA15 family ATPase/GTPase